MKKTVTGGVAGILFLMLVASLFPNTIISFFGLIRKTFSSGNGVVLEIPLEENSGLIPLGKISPSGDTPKVSYKRVLISEVMAGTSASAADEFVELYNPNDEAVSLTGWSIKKRSGTGSESSLVSSVRFRDKSIPPRRYFLIAHDGGHLNTPLSPDVLWPKSYSLSSSGGVLVLYNPEGEIVDEVGWDSIPKNQSVARVSWDDSAFSLLPISTPQSSTR